MRDVSLHILDLIENSINARSNKIEVVVDESTVSKTLKIKVIDDGCGIEKENLKDIFSPFFTSNKNKSVGLGLALFKESAEMTGGNVKIGSEEKKGTVTEGTYKTDNINFIGKGDINKSLAVMAVANPQIHFIFRVKRDEKEIILDTKRLKGNEKIELKDYKGILNILGTV